MISGIDLVTLMDFWFDSERQSIYTAIPARVESYDASGPEVDVTPVVGRLWRDRDEGYTEASALPKLTGVPVQFPAGGGCGVTFPIAEGDYVLLLVSTFALSRWYKDGAEIEQTDHLTHQLEQSIALPGLFHKGSKFTDLADANNVKIGEDGAENQIVIEPGGEIKIGATASSYAAKADLVQSEISALWTALNAHTHTGVTTGGGSSGPPAGAGIPGSAGSVAADRVKVK